jgi:hypothetical protein
VRYEGPDLLRVPGDQGQRDAHDRRACRAKCAKDGPSG